MTTVIASIGTGRTGSPFLRTWSDSPIGTKLLGIGIWHEGGANHTQIGNPTWPDPIPAWTADQRTTASDACSTWVSNIIATWSNKFDLRRDGCASTNQSCCRYSVKIDGVSFTKVTSMSANTIVVGHEQRAVVGRGVEPG